MSKFWTFFLRTIQLICAAVVLALSICAVRWQYRNSVPATNAFVTFAGAFGCLVALLGFAAVVIDVLAGIFMLAHDILATIFLLAGGIAYAVGLSGVNCDDPDNSDTWFNRLINGGCTWNTDEQVWDCSFWADSDLTKRCNRAKANTAFLFIAAVVSLVAAIVSALSIKKRRSGLVSTSRS